MPQSPIVIGTLNSTRGLPLADLPVDPTFLVEVQPPAPVVGVDPPRQQVSIASIIGGGGGVAGSGTADTLTKWSDTDTVADSSITDDGTDVAIDANASVSGTFGVTGATALDGATTIDDTLHVTGIATFDVTPVFTGNLQAGGYNGQSIGVGLTAVGTDRATALALTKGTNIVATAASAAVGVVLPSAASVGVGNWVDVYNDGPSNAFHVYAAGSDTIDGTAGATGKNLTNAFWCRYVVTAAATFVSYRSPITRSA